MKHTAKLRVRSYECDSYGHVNNANYLNYLEFARMDYLYDIGFDYNGMFEAGYRLYVTQINISYKASALLYDDLLIDTETVKLKKISGTFLQKIYKKDGTVCAEAEVSWACVNKDGRPTKFPEEFIVEGLLPTSE